MSGSRPLRSSLPILAASSLAASLFVTRSAHAQSAAVDPASTPPDTPASKAEAKDAPYVFDGRGVYVGGGAGLVPQAGDASFATRIQVVFPVRVDWVAIELGLLGQYYSAEDHHGESVSVDVGTITAGGRFTFPPDRVIRPYVAPRIAHMHFFPDPYGDDHGHSDGHADHETHHRWGAGGGIGFDAGIPGPASRFRVGVDLEAFALTGPNVNVIGQAVALFGVGF